MLAAAEPSRPALSDMLREGTRDAHRAAERGPFVRAFLRGPLDRYAGIDARTVAAAMTRLASRTEPGHFVHHNRELRELTRT